MSKNRTMKRKLRQDRVMLAEETQYERIKIAQKVVEERVKKDVEFARDVLKAVGENLPASIKTAAEKCIANDEKSKETGWAMLPEDPLLIGGAPESNYPENRGMVDWDSVNKQIVDKQ